MTNLNNEPRGRPRGQPPPRANVLLYLTLAAVLLVIAMEGVTMESLLPAPCFLLACLSALFFVGLAIYSFL